MKFSPDQLAPCGVPEPAGFDVRHDGYATVFQTFRAPSGALSISLQFSPARMRAALQATGFSVAVADRTAQDDMRDIPPPDIDPGVITSGLCATPDDQEWFDLAQAGKPPGAG